MKRPILQSAMWLPLLTAAWCGSIANNLADTSAISVAVFDFESSSTAKRSAGAEVSALLNATLSAEPDLLLVERAELDKLFSEQEFGLSGAVGPGTAAVVGQMTGAKILISGRIITLESGTTVVAKVIGTETGRVFARVARSETGDLAEIATTLSGQLAAIIREKRADLVAEQIEITDRIQILRKALEGKRRGTVTVSIPERHFGGPVIDPAAQTEFGRMLKAVGFRLVDPGAGSDADFEVSGEAFSAFGLRKGNLISCRARVEIEAKDLKSGELVAVDRQTSIALELSEQIAAKNALQEAAAALAARVIPALAR